MYFAIIWSVLLLPIGGRRANTIHYTANNQIVSAGELVLMDAGCECHGYTSDITRTWPVSGTIDFSFYSSSIFWHSQSILIC